jgi:Protein of unknown function (DUF1501)
MDAFASHRRAFLLSGGLSLLGLTDTSLARLRAASNDRRKHNSCVFLFLLGGPSQIDLWDMKPDATEQIRGEFRPKPTTVPGIQICEHLPRLGRIMDKICLVRSMTHRMNVHGPACSEVLSGRPYHQAPTTDQASREDWPSLSSLAMRYGKPRNGLPPSAVLPWYLHFPGQPKRIAGQTGGRMGDRHNAFLVSGDIERPEFQLAGLQPDGDLLADRIDARQKLLERLEPTTASDPLESSRRIALDLLASHAGRALDLKQEPRSVRDAYGPSAVGQSLLMARRLVEAGVSLVTVNWQDETKIDGVNTCWDTHQNNFTKLKTLLCPTFDRAFPAFIDDLHQRGLLETTLVVAVGEFGRTPKMGQFEQSSNTQKTGRDHWPHAFTAILAGGGVRGGLIYGATTKDAGYVIEKPVTPADLSATILHHLGIDPGTIYEDEFQHLRNRLSDGRVVRDWA